MLNRDSNLIYADINGATHIISPINALISKKIIERFDPIQACYIGILAGTANPNRTKSKLPKESKIVQMKLIK